MKIAEFELDDGRIALFEVDDSVTEQEVMEYVKGFDWGSVAQKPQVESPEAQEYVENHQNFLANLVDKETQDEWRIKGEMGIGEAYSKLNKWKMLPFLNGKEAIDNLQILNLVNRHTDGETLTDEEKNKVREWYMDMVEVETRGFTTMGHITNGLLQMPAFAGEFAATGGLLSLGKKAALKGGQQAIKQAVKKGITETIKRGAVGTAKLAATGAARTVLMPHRVINNYAETRLGDGLVLTDKGEYVLQEVEQKPATTVMRAIGDVMIENISEQTGEAILAPLFGRVTKYAKGMLPKKLVTAFTELTEKSTNMPIQRAMKSMGWNGILEELGEERIGELLRTTFDLDPQEGYSFDQFTKAMFPDSQQLLIEAGVIGAWGGSSRATQFAVNKLTNAGVPNAQDVVNNLSETQREELANRVSPETAETEARYIEQKQELINQMVDTGVVDIDGAEQVVTLIDARVAASAEVLKMTKAERLQELAIEIQKGVADEFMADLPTSQDFSDVPFQSGVDVSSKISQLMKTKNINNIKDFTKLINNAKKSKQLKQEISELLGNSKQPIRFENKDTFAFVSQETYDGGLHRVTYFNNEKQPSGHATFKTKSEAIAKALDDGYVPVANQTLFQSSTPDTIDSDFNVDYEAIQQSPEYQEKMSNLDNILNIVKQDDPTATVRTSINRNGDVSSYIEANINNENITIRVSDHDTNYDLSDISMYFNSDIDKFKQKFEEIKAKANQQYYFQQKVKEKRTALLNEKKSFLKENIPESYYDFVREKNLKSSDIKALKKAIKNKKLPKIDFKYLMSYQDVLNFINNIDPIITLQEDSKIRRATPLFQSSIPDTIEINGTQKPTTNSEGKPIASTEQGIRNFYKWFGDSKVVDEQGRPLVVYHGTEATGFMEFDTSGSGKTEGTGAFFSNTLAGAMTYSGSREIFKGADLQEIINNYEKYNIEIEKISDNEYQSTSIKGYTYTGETIADVITKMYEADAIFDEVKGNYETYLSLKNPLIVDFEGRDWQSYNAPVYYHVLDADMETIDTFMNREDAEFFINTESENYGEMTIEEDIDIYSDFTETTDSIARQAREDGYDGVIFEDIIDEGRYGRGYGDGDVVYVAFNPEQIKSVDNIGEFSQTDPNIYKQDARGAIQLGKRNIITLFEGADKSTILHELGHLFLRDMERLSTISDNAQLKREMDAIRTWLKNDGGAFTIEQQEQFARGFEQYLRTGKAPTSKLARAFDKFKEWLRSVYSSAKMLKADIAPDVARVFDSMLMTEAEKVETGFYEQADIGVFETLFQEARDLFVDDAKIQTELDNIEDVLSGRKTEVEGMTYDRIVELLKVINQRIPKAPQNMVNYMKSNNLYVKESSARGMGIYDILNEYGLIRKKSGITREDSLIDALRDFIPVYDDAETYEQTSEQWQMVVNALENARDTYKVQESMQIEYRENVLENIEYAERLLNMTQEKSDIFNMIKDLKKSGYFVAGKEQVKQIKKQVKDIEKRVRDITKANIKITQSTVQNFIKSLPISLNNKAKLMTELRKSGVTTTKEQALNNIKDKAVDFIEQEYKQKATRLIKRELKTSKSKVIAGKRKGKFDYETNKIFAELNNFNKLKKDNAVAELEKYASLEDASEVDLIYSRFLSYKANGLKSSVELISRVLEDIQTLKETGKLAKSELDLADKINKKERLDEARNYIDNIKDSGAIKRKYLSYVGNINSFMTALFGSEFADKNGFEIGQNEAKVWEYKEFNKILDKSKSVFNAQNKYELIDKFQEMSVEDKELVNKNGGVVKISVMKIIDIYNSIGDDIEKRNYFNTYGEGKILELIQSLTPEQIAFAEMLQQTVQDYYPIIKEKFIELNGLDMPKLKHYWPATNLHTKQDVDIFKEFQAKTVDPSFIKERNKGMKTPIPKNALEKTKKHLKQVAYFQYQSDNYRNIKRLLLDNDLQLSIKNKFDDSVLKSFNDLVDLQSLSSIQQIMSGWEKDIGAMVRNWSVAKISLNPWVFATQLGSFSNFAVDMPVSDFITGFVKGISNPKQTIDFMFKNNEWLRERWDNQSINEAIEAANSYNTKYGGKRQRLQNQLTALVRMGDLGAIIFGGYPVVIYNQSQGKSLKEANEIFRKQALSSQQSSDSSSLSLLQQNRSGLMRAILAFRNTPTQYARKVGDAIIKFQANEMDNITFGKTMLNYLVLQPMLYVTLKDLVSKLLGGDKDEEDTFDDIMIAIASGWAEALPILDEIIEELVRGLYGKSCWFGRDSIGIKNDIINAIKDASKKDSDFTDIIYIVGKAGLETQGMPVTNVERIYKGISK